MLKNACTCEVVGKNSDCQQKKVRWNCENLLRLELLSRRFGHTPITRFCTSLSFVTVWRKKRIELRWTSFKVVKKLVCVSFFSVFWDDQIKKFVPTQGYLWENDVFRLWIRVWVSLAWLDQLRTVLELYMSLFAYAVCRENDMNGQN